MPSYYGLSQAGQPMLCMTGWGGNHFYYTNIFFIII